MRRRIRMQLIAASMRARSRRAAPSIRLWMRCGRLTGIAPRHRPWRAIRACLSGKTGRAPGHPIPGRAKQRWPNTSIASARTGECRFGKKGEGRRGIAVVASLHSIKYFFVVDHKAFWTPNGLCPLILQSVFAIFFSSDFPLPFNLFQVYAL